MGSSPQDAAAVSPEEGVTAEQVLAFLRRHPDFLVRHPELLEEQIATAPHRGDGIVDLQQVMLDRLRQDIAKLRADQDDLLANSRDNLSTQERIHKAALALLAAQSFEHLIDMVTADLAALLEVDVVALCVEAAEEPLPKTRVEGVQILAPGSVDRILGFGREALLRDDVAGDPLLFGKAARKVRSDALLRLSISHGTPMGLLAFGARHPGYFNPGQGTELLSFLARVLEHAVREWLDLPR